MEINLQSKTGLVIRCDSTYEPVAVAGPVAAYRATQYMN